METKIVQFGGNDTYEVSSTENCRVVNVSMKVNGKLLATFKYNYRYRSIRDCDGGLDRTRLNIQKNIEYDISRGLNVISGLDLQCLTLFPENMQKINERTKMLHYIKDFGTVYIGRSIIDPNQKDPITNAALDAVSCYYGQNLDLRKSKHIIIVLEYPVGMYGEGLMEEKRLSSLFPNASSDLIIISRDIPDNETAHAAIIVSGEEEELRIERQTPMYPQYRIPIKGMTKDEYLRILVIEGAKKRYGDTIPENVRQRINNELDMIRWYNASDYFLLWYDLLTEARKDLGAMTGPGRSSAAGSIVNYCLGITNIDPLEYGLLFERFLNLNRKRSLPSIDIDIDFDEESREKVMAWAEKKYTDRCARISTYHYNKDGAVDTVGIHVCGAVLCNKPISDIVPLRKVVDHHGHEVDCTIYGGENVEDIGLIKLDFLSLNELSLQKAVIAKIKEEKHIIIDMDKIPTDDALTMALFQEGKTTKINQFDGRSMRKFLRQMNPTTFKDLILINAMLRPGIIDSIPKLIERKNRPELTDDVLHCLSSILDETYGMVVYQEQVMLISQKIADFSPKQSDRLRKAICKQKTKDLILLKSKFIKGGIAKGYSRDTMIRLWKKINDEGIYAFCKSHVACYTYIAYSSAYLYVHFPAIFNKIYRDYYQYK